MVDEKRLYYVGKRIFQPILGKTWFQWLFESLYGFSLLGMNFAASDVNNSGEKLVLKMLKKKYEGSKITVFDVGANVGNYTSLVLDVFGEDVKVFAFEPAKITFERLKAQLRERKNSQLASFNLGLGKEKKTCDLFSDNECSVLASLYNRRLEYIDKRMSHVEQVRIETLDNVCSLWGINRIHLLKLDVEGNELDVLQGGKKMLGDNLIDYIQFEFGGCNIDSRTYFQDLFYLLNDKYRIYRILQNGLRPIDRYSGRNEIFVTVNYLAERRGLLTARQ